MYSKVIQLFIHIYSYVYIYMNTYNIFISNIYIHIIHTYIFIYMNMYVQQSDIVIHTYIYVHICIRIYILFQILFPYRL